MAQKPKRRANTKRDNEELASTYSKMSSRGKYRKKKSKKMQTASAVLIVAISLIVVAAIFIGCAFLVRRNQSGVFAENIMIAGVNVGGLTKDDATSAIQEATRGTYTVIPMTVTVLDTQITIAPSVSGASLDIEAAVNAAFKNGKAGQTIDIIPFLKLNDAAVREALNVLGDKYSSTRSQHKYEITGAEPDNKLVIIKGTPEYGLDMQALYNNVISAYNNNVFDVKGACETIDPEPLNFEKIWEDAKCKLPKDAYYDAQTGAFVDGENGYGFDIDKAKETLAAAQPGSTIEILFESISPSITKEMLAAEQFKDILFMCTATEADSDDDRNTNLRLACEAINGIVLNPGDTFSYNQALGERTEKKGYRPGPSFENGKETKTIGGGICQVSSALYYCAVMADLETKKRDCHMFFVDYVPKGMDAAVSWGTLDFCFRNNTEHPIRIDAVADGGSVTVKLLGTDDKDYKIKIDTEEYGHQYPEELTQTFTKDNKDGYTNGQVIQKPHTGFTVKTYRVRCDKETGEEIGRELEDISTYDKLDKVTCVIEDNSSTGSESGNENESGSATPGIGNGGVTDSDGALP